MKVDIKLTKEDIEIAKSVDDDYREDCFIVSYGELYYLTGNDYPTLIRRCNNGASEQSKK